MLVVGRGFPLFFGGKVGPGVQLGQLVKSEELGSHGHIRVTKYNVKYLYFDITQKSRAGLVDKAISLCQWSPRLCHSKVLPFADVTALPMPIFTKLIS